MSPYSLETLPLPTIPILANTWTYPVLASLLDEPGWKHDILCCTGWLNSARVVDNKHKSVYTTLLDYTHSQSPAELQWQSQEECGQGCKGEQGAEFILNS